MVETTAIARKWGNSIGITLSKETVARQGIKPNDRLIVSVKRAKSFEDLFGTFKTRKTAQQLKDEARKGWG